jgi:hypothetical protein
MCFAHSIREAHKTADEPITPYVSLLFSVSSLKLKPRQQPAFRLSQARLAWPVPGARQGRRLRRCRQHVKRGDIIDLAACAEILPRCVLRLKF